MVEKEMQWQTLDGLPLFARQREPETAAKGVICLIHGLGEHSGRYHHWAERLTGAGYAMVSIDLRGHGKSGGPRGDAPSFDHLADDIELMLDYAREKFVHLPCFLYGHSLGGMLAFFYLVQRRPRLAGTVITSPLLHSVLDLRKDRIAMLKAMGIILPGLSISNNLELEALSKDPAVAAAYRHDPLVHDRVSLRMGKGFLDAISYIFDRASEIKLPLLIMHGTGDRITFPSGSEQAAGLVAGKCTLKLWEDCYHELHNEIEKDRVFDYLIKWLDNMVDQTKTDSQPGNH